MAKNLTFTISSPDNAIDETCIPVILLHGWGLNSGVWQPLLTSFSEQNKCKFQLITLDLPGFGNNIDVNIEPYDLTNICRHIAQTIKQPAIYLGWSLGGLVATQMALNYPNKVLGLITVASSPYFVEQALQDWPGIKPNVLESFHQQLAKDTEKTISGFLKIQAMGSPHIRQDLKQISQLVMAYPLPTEQTLSKSLNLLSHCDLRPSLSTIKQPFLRLYGNNDSLVPKATIEKIQQLSPASEQHIFPHASHAPFISHLADFNQQLTNWLCLHFTENK